MTGRVLVVGSINVDLVIAASRLPSPGETVADGTFARHHGGKGGNQAAAAARLGAQTEIVAAVGSDAFGEEARTALIADGVGVRELRTDEAAATGVALVVVGQGGDNLIAVAPGANAGLKPSEVAASLGRLAVGPGDVVLVVMEVPAAAAREALAVARRAGAVTVLNPAPASGVDRSLFGLADVVTPNRGELAALLTAESAGAGRRRARATDLPRAAQTLLRPIGDGDGAGAVLVTLGAHGALLVRPDLPPLELAPPRVVAVDTVGAGDALNGALAAGLAAGYDLERAGRRAVVAASLSTTRPGARGGLPTVSELEARLGGGGGAGAGPT